jgi:tetratricopeptide (TPR) repeat protein
MQRWSYCRIPLILYTAAVAAASYETSQSVTDLEYARREATQAWALRYPDLPDNLYMRGLGALDREDYPEARRLFESALEMRLYTNEGLLHNYARLLAYLGEPREDVDHAAELWRKHFPYSTNADPREYY